MEHERRYQVVRSDDGAYSIWPEAKELPLGWQAHGSSGSKDDCIAWIDAVWTDLRPANSGQRSDSLNT